MKQSTFVPQLPSPEPQATSKCLCRMTTSCDVVLTKVPHGVSGPHNALNMIFYWKAAAYSVLISRVEEG